MKNLVKVLAAIMALSNVALFAAFPAHITKVADKQKYLLTEYGVTTTANKHAALDKLEAELFENQLSIAAQTRAGDMELFSDEITSNETDSQQEGRSGKRKAGLAPSEDNTEEDTEDNIDGLKAKIAKFETAVSHPDAKKRLAGQAKKLKNLKQKLAARRKAKAQEAFDITKGLFNFDEAFTAVMAKAQDKDALSEFIQAASAHLDDLAIEDGIMSEGTLGFYNPLVEAEKARRVEKMNEIRALIELLGANSEEVREEVARLQTSSDLEDANDIIREAGERPAANLAETQAIATVAVNHGGLRMLNAVQSVFAAAGTAVGSYMSVTPALVRHVGRGFGWTLLYNNAGLVSAVVPVVAAGLTAVTLYGVVTYITAPQAEERAVHAVDMTNDDRSGEVDSSDV